MENKLEKLYEKIKEIYPNDYDAVIKSLESKRSTTFRINTLKKASPSEIIASLNLQGFIIAKGPLTNSFIVTESEKKLSETKEFENGEIYIQELSSMIPALALDLEEEEEESILDLCAAPGSKTTQIAELTQNKAFITVVEKSKDRFFALKANLENYGVFNVDFILANGVGLEKRNPRFINFFDKVLIDAPCTNEARININDPKTYKFWNPKKYKELSRVQKGLLISGLRMLKPGGTLVYSTCTFSVQENELVINWLLEKVSNLVVERLNPNILGIKELNTREGITYWKGKELDKQIKNTHRILPTDLFSGFYIAKIKKPI